MSTITVKLPEGFMNVAVTIDNHLIADTNDSAKWDTLKFPLPSGSWCIYNQSGGVITLHKINKNE